MKTYLVSILFWASICLQGSAQNVANSPSTSNGTPDSAQQVGTEPFHDFTDEGVEPPAFPGGEAALLKYLGGHIQYPKHARAYNIQGVVALTFIVEKDGRVNQVTILKDIGGGCGEEAARVVSEMPNWRPGMVDGEQVRVRFTLLVRFRLEEEATTKAGGKKKWWQREALFGGTP